MRHLMPGVVGGEKSAPTSIVAASIRLLAAIGRGRNAAPHDGQATLYTAERGITWFADDLYRAVRPRIHLG
jgi:hypothetical protein